jgi:plastocyanin
MTGTVRKALVLIAIGSLLSACSGQAGSTGTTVTATLKEWEIKLSSTDLPAGDITINFTNNGDKEHEFLVRKTDLKADSLPIVASGDDKGRVDEESSELTEVGNPSEIAVIPPGTTGLSLRVTLEPGHYVVFCNLHVEDLLHYEKGMHLDFTVT